MDVEYITWLEPVYSRPVLMFLIYTASEVLFGIIPPEIFMVWALNQGDMATYVSIVALLLFISYGAGWLAYSVGKRSHHTSWYRYLKRKYFSKYEIYLNEFGSFLIIVASVTPLPFAGVCMLVGAANYKTSRFLLYSLFRVVRFIVYASIIWEANTL
ncbi:MAG: VTT domain-containing protein [Saprospirales bacterium]|nr:VTT domain-containing protein [Saprospirales bacterium]